MASVMLVSGMSGCSSNSAQTALSAPANCDNPDPGVSAQTIDVGAIFPTTGPQGPFFEAIGSGILARFSVANQAGGIGGRKLVLQTADDGDGASENLSAAQYLVQDDKVFGIIEGSTNSDGSAQFLKDSGIPVTGWAITPA